MKSLKPLLSTYVRSRVLTGLLVLFLGSLNMLPAIPTLAAGSGTWTLKGERHMNRSGLRPCLAAFLTAIVVSVGLLSLSSAPAWAAAGTITEFTIPTKGTPFDITAGPDGNLWFTDGAGEIGRITPSGSITEFPVPSGSFRITAGPDGNLWFTGYSTGEIGRITPGGSITEFPTPDGAWGITAGPDGNLWFADPGGNKIGRITPGGSITEFRLPGNCGKYGTCAPHGITSGSDGNLWFTEENGNAIGHISTSGSFIPGGSGIPTAKSRPEGITAGPDGNVWFTEENGNKIGRITTS
jgi:streptogramin lyase